MHTIKLGSLFGMTLYTVLQVKTSWSMLQLLFKGFCNQT